MSSLTSICLLFSYIFNYPVEYKIVPHITLDNLQSPLDILVIEVGEDDERLLGPDQTSQGANGFPDQRIEDPQPLTVLAEAHIVAPRHQNVQ